MPARFALLICLCSTVASADDSLEIYFIDVEGGAATLVVTPDRESILIDSGYPDNNGRDRDRILQTLKRAGLKRIDHAVVSHWHMDHYGNHAALSTEIPIGTFWDRGIPDALREDKNFPVRITEYRRASENKSKALKVGDVMPLKSTKGTPLKVRVLTSGERSFQTRAKKTRLPASTLQRNVMRRTTPLVYPCCWSTAIFDSCAVGT